MNYLSCFATRPTRTAHLQLRSIWNAFNSICLYLSLYGFWQRNVKKSKTKANRENSLFFYLLLVIKKGNPPRFLMATHPLQLYTPYGFSWFTAYPLHSLRPLWVYEYHIKSSRNFSQFSWRLEGNHCAGRDINRAAGARVSFYCCLAFPLFYFFLQNWNSKS